MARADRHGAARRASAVSGREHLRGLLAVIGGGLRPLSTALVLGLLILLLWQGATSMLAQPVAHIAVSGKLESRHREAVRATVAGSIDGGLLTLDLRTLRTELEALPWIYRASLRRQFPDTLAIHVIEQLPIARWGDSGFLNHEARVIEVTDARRWESLPLIRGPEGSEARLMAHYQRLLELLRPLELQPQRLVEDSFAQLTVALDNGVELLLGDRELFAERVDNFLILWRRELRADAARVARVDMRYADGAAVAFTGEPQVAALTAETEDR